MPVRSSLIVAGLRQRAYHFFPPITPASSSCLSLRAWYACIESSKCRRARSDSAGAGAARPRAVVRGGGHGGGGSAGGWMDDDDSPSCLLCDALFTFTNRWVLRASLAAAHFFALDRFRLEGVIGRGLYPTRNVLTLTFQGREPLLVGLSRCMGWGLRRCDGPEVTRLKGACFFCVPPSFFFFLNPFLGLRTLS